MSSLVRFAVLAALALVVAAGQLAGPQRAYALDIDVIYDPNQASAVNPCDEGMAACSDGVDQTPKLEFTVQLAAEHWMDIIEDEHEMTVRFWWADISDPDANVIETDANGRPTVVHLRVPANKSWYYDPFPALDDEYQMVPRLVRTLHPDEFDEVFLGNPPEVFEVAYTGTGPGNDLMTAMLHELGHGMGLENDVVGHPSLETCTQADPYYHLNPTWMAGQNVSIRGFLKGDGTTDCPHLDLGGITECKTDPIQDPLSDDPSTIPGQSVYECTSHQALMWVSEYPNSRVRPSIADILAIAAAADWQVIDLPRKYSLETGLWSDGSTWLGDRVPDSNDDVFLLNQESTVTVTAFEGGHARNIRLSDGNSLELFFELFTTAGTITLGAETSLTVDTSAHLDAGRVLVGLDSLFDVSFNGTADVDEVNVFGSFRGQGVLETLLISNAGAIQSNGGELTVIAKPGGLLDLDGGLGGSSLNNPSIVATTGDIVFDGPMYDTVRAAIHIGPGYRITFTEGWQQEFGTPGINQLWLEGTGAEATVAGDSTLGGAVIVDGTGRFTSDAMFTMSADLALDIAGPTAGTEHDQLRVDGMANFAGELQVAIDPAFEPEPGDTFVVVEYGSHSGFFDTITVTGLNSDLELVPEYEANELRLRVHLIGDVNGDGMLSPKDIPALNQQLGPCPPDPELCPADLDGDGDVDVQDRLILIGLIKAAKDEAKGM